MASLRDRYFGNVFDGEWWISDVQSDIWMHTNPAYAQDNFRFRNDDGSETTATWKATAGTSITLKPGDIFRIRLQITETAGASPSGTLTPTLYISKNSGTWTAGASQSDVALFDSTNLTNDGTTTEQLAGAQGFVAGRVLDTGWSGSTVTLASQNTEYEWCLQVAASGFNSGDTLDFRAQDGTTAFASYSSVPRVTVRPPTIVDVTTNLATSSVGNVSIPQSVSTTLTTNLLTTSVGTATASIPAIVSVTGESVTSAVGTADHVFTVAYTPTGEQATSAVGTADATGTAITAVTGEVATSTVGTADFLFTVSYVVGGQEIVSAVGSVTVDEGQSLTYLRPSADITDGGWTTDAGATTLSLAVDEPSFNDADYIKSSEGPSNDTCEIRLDSGTDPISSANHTLRFRVWVTKSARLTAKLMCGATEIASWDYNSLTGTPTEIAETLTSGQADAITDYTDLRVRFTANLPA